MLGVQALHEADEGTGTGVRRQYGGSVLAAQRVFWVILDRTSEEPAMQIKNRCATR